MSNCISWDIGIKNLAYCSLDSNNSNSTCNTIIFNNPTEIIIDNIAHK